MSTQSILAEFRNNFKRLILKDGEYGYGIYAEDFYKQETFLAKAIEETRHEERKQTIEGIKKTFDNDLKLAHQVREEVRSGYAGYASGVLSRAITNLSELKGE